MSFKKKPSIKKTSTRRLPMGIHESWFDMPEQVDGRAFCDRHGCECGSIERSHESSLIQAVADSLYMDTSWHHYDQTHDLWLNTPTSSAEYQQRQEEMLRASCDIMMSQQVLREFSNEVVATLKKKTVQAENRGYDISSPCDAGNQLACEYHAAVQLFRQLKADADALKTPRQTLAITAELPLDQ